VTKPISVPTSFSTEAVRGTLWNYLSFFSGKLLNFISTIILARLLVPEQFGLVAYCTIAIQYIDIINTAGLGSALIARKDKFEQAANAAFVASIFLGFSSVAISWFSAPFIADFFHQEEVTDLFRVLSLSFPISNFGLVGCYDSIYCSSRGNLATTGISFQKEFKLGEKTYSRGYLSGPVTLPQ